MTTKSSLSATDPPPFTVINEQGETPLLIACDHAHNRIPKSLNNLGLAAHDLQLHIACDIGARQVARLLAEQFNAPLLLANYSRLVIDLNRHPHAESLIVEQSDGVTIPGNIGLSKSQKQQRISDFFTPYHNEYSRLVEQLQARHRHPIIHPIILAVHSFTPRMQGQDRPWHYGVLWDEAHKKLAQRLLRGFADRAIKVGDNQPYHANDPQGYAQVMHAERNNLEMALIEIRQDLIASTAGQKKAAQDLYAVLSPLLGF